MTFVPFPPWEPDRAEYAQDGGGRNTRNVLPIRDGWAPFPGLSPIGGDPLPGPCRGAAWVRRTDGTTDIYAASADKLYRLSGTDLSWVDVSRTGSAYLGVPSGEYWSFRQYTNQLVVTNANDEPQIIDVDTGTEFADLTGGPDKARFAATVGYQLGLFSHLDDALRLSLSGYGDASFWTRFRNGSGRQVLASGGWIQGVVGDQSGAFIFQQDRIARLTLMPSSDASFRVDEWERDRGTVAPASVVSVGNMVFYRGEDDFYLLGQAPGESSRALGVNRVADFVLTTQTGDTVSWVQGAADPINKRVFWRWWTSGLSDEQQSNGIIVYDWNLDRWSRATITAQYVFPAATQGYTLEGLDAVATLDSLPFSLDSRVWQGGRPVLAAFDGQNRLCFFDAASPPGGINIFTSFVPLAGEGRRAFVQGFRPIADGSGFTGVLHAKDTYGGTSRTGPAWAQDTTGMIPTGTQFDNRGGDPIMSVASGRLHRLQLQSVSSTLNWSNLTGIEVKWRPEGRR